MPLSLGKFFLSNPLPSLVSLEATTLWDKYPKHSIYFSSFFFFPQPHFGTYHLHFGTEQNIYCLFLNHKVCEKRRSSLIYFWITPNSQRAWLTYRNASVYACMPTWVNKDPCHEYRGILVKILYLEINKKHTCILFYFLGSVALPFIYIYIYIILKYSILALQCCYFLLCNEGNQPCVCIYPFFLRLLPLHPTPSL